ncbi:MAG TPA: DNA polymerase III subunit alpha, partial [Syntrophobacteraceae bacterium]|nr:DNA polymerase III subunit alpha [Syntrophobacteraceae bacterium]
IRFGLGAVRNVGEAAIEGIIRSREEHGEFQSFYDFVERVDSQRVNRRVLEQLIKCGAFDTLHPRRACVFAALDAALERAQVAQRDRQSGQVNMFASLRNKKKQGQALALPDVPDWDGRQTLLFEKESLGFYLSGHPLDSYRDQLAALCTIDTQKITERADGSEVVLCGILSITKEVTTKKGERMAFLTLEDKEGTREVVLFPEVFGKARDLLAGDEPRVVMGTVQQDDKGAKILANRILALEEAQVETVEMVHIRLYADRLDADAMARLRHLLVSNPGECRTQLHLFVGEDTEAVIALSSKLTVNPSPTFFEEMDQYFGQGCAAATYKTCMN